MIELTTKAAIEHVLSSGASKYSVAKLLALSPIMVNNYLKGTKMSHATASKMEALFGIKITDSVQRTVS